MRLKLGHSYLIKKDSSPSSMKAVVLDVTNTLYHIRWGSGEESWHPKDKFGRDGAVVPYIVQKEIAKAVVIEPEEYRSMIRDLANRLSDAAGFYEQLEQKSEFKVTQAHKRALRMNAKMMRDMVGKANSFIAKKQEA